MRLAGLVLLVALWPSCGAVAADAPRPTEEAVRQWQARKFGLFIHFGLYSMLGGVWNGARVTEGYSEQIMRHAPIPRDEYAALAGKFDPEKWDADAIAKLAREAGMKFIVLTAKHHDGFNMFATKLSPFNIVDATPYHRDIVGSLAEACRKQGLSFGVYYSTIDWHDQRATPPSRPPTNENDNLIPKAHEDFNVGQLKELLSRYGPLSEVWFDMGQPTPEQSRRFADTVHGLQRNCMVSGRVFNSQGDFTVMGDNNVPNAIIDEPWQTPASIYDETWGYRSWEDRKDVQGKINEHILKLVKVVSRGGNYLLNIGPEGDGSVVPFEADVLHGIGRWMQANAEAIYDTQPQPFRELDFGYATVKPGKLYLFVEKRPEDDKLRLPGLRSEIVSASVLGQQAKLPVVKGTKETTIDVSAMRETAPVTVVTAEYKGELKVIPPAIPADASGVVRLDAAAATRYFNYNGRGYYEPPSIYKLRWDFAAKEGRYRVEIEYKNSGADRRAEVVVADRTLLVVFGKGEQRVAAGVVDLGAAEATALTVTPRRPFAKGEKLGVEVVEVVLMPVRGQATATPIGIFEGHGDVGAVLTPGVAMRRARRRTRGGSMRRIHTRLV